MPLRIGEAFAGYRVLRLLGSGGMGEVYLVQHPRLPRQEALKVLRSDISGDESFRERFMREADLAAGLRHPSIVSIYDRGEHDGQLWIAMDYIDGTDAGRLLERKYPAGMPTDLVVRITTDIASALDYARKKGLLHRDVKPANIIVADLDGEEPEVYLADFGIARPLDDTSGITTTNMTVGTVAYAAPEQLMGEPMDGRADQYALAATTYHLLTGGHLFSHSNPAVVISKHLSTNPPMVSDRRPDCTGLDEVLQIALAKDPADRFPTCSEFAQALADESCAQGAVSAHATTQAAGRPRSSASTTAKATPTPPAARSRRAWAVLGGFAATILLIAVIGIIVWRPWQHPQSNATGTPSSNAPTATEAAPPPAPTSAAPEPPATSGVAAPPPATTSKVPQGNGFALTGCYYHPDNLPVDRPTSVGVFFCASGGMSVNGMSWTSWGPYGADGTGIAHFRVCQPSCAEGYEVPTPVVIHAWNPLPSPGDSGCPRDVRFFADMILAFPNDEPPMEANMPALSRYNGMPAIRYTSYSDPGPPIEQMGSPTCY